MSNPPVKPSLTVKSMASMMRMPACEQLRILTEQKHPKRGAAPFRRPYYAQAYAAIRSHYERGRSPTAIADHRRTISASLVRRDRKEHNLRVLQDFAKSPQAARILVPGPRPKVIKRDIAGYGIELRLRFDLDADENGRYKHIFYNPLMVPIDEEIARTTLELAHWALDDEGVSMRDLEYVDLVGGKTFTWTKPRKSTFSKVVANAKVIATLWQTL